MPEIKNWIIHWGVPGDSRQEIITGTPFSDGCKNAGLSFEQLYAVRYAFGSPMEKAQAIEHYGAFIEEFPGYDRVLIDGEWFELDDDFARRSDIRLFIDDKRATPEGWVRVFNARHAIHFLNWSRPNMVAEISFDHDYGNSDVNQWGWVRRFAFEEQEVYGPTLAQLECMEHDRGDGTRVAQWINFAVGKGHIHCPDWQVHSANPIGGQGIDRYMSEARELFEERRIQQRRALDELAQMDADIGEI